jgi:purine nucleosidase
MKELLDPVDRLERLTIPAGILHMVLDTDTYNEVDDQFALMYALASPERLQVEAVYAAPYFNSRSTGPADGMEKSYREILRLLDVAGNDPLKPHKFAIPVLRGSDRYLPDGQTPVGSAAAADLVERALARPIGDPLYVVAIGAITNIASAILTNPEIIRHVVVVWLGGHALYWHDTREFNLKQDIAAARVVFDSGVPLIQIPAMNVASHLLTSVYELEACLGGRNALCDTLIELFKSYHKDHFAWNKEIWDIAAIACLLNPVWVPTVLAPSPILTDQCTWSVDAGRHMIRVATAVDRNAVFLDMMTRLAGFY